MFLALLIGVVEVDVFLTLLIGVVEVDVFLTLLIGVVVVLLARLVIFRVADVGAIDVFSRAPLLRRDERVCGFGIANLGATLFITAWSDAAKLVFGCGPGTGDLGGPPSPTLILLSNHALKILL
jgi:hypothetical protein